MFGLRTALRKARQLDVIVEFIDQRAREAESQVDPPAQWHYEVLAAHLQRGADGEDAGVHSAVMELIDRLTDLEEGIEEIRDVTSRL